MRYKFTPESYYEALGFFYSIPFYSFKDLIHKRDFILNASEITSIEKFIGKDPVCKVDYKVEKFDGWFLLRKNIDLSKFGDVKVIHFRKYDPIDFANFKLIFKCFFNTPIFGSILFALIYSSVFINYRKMFFPGFINPEAYINAYCNASCINLAANVFSIMTMIVGLALGEIGIGFFFYFYISSKIRSAHHYNFIRHSSLLLIIINLLTINMFIKVSLENNNWKMASIIYHRAYNPKYFDDPVNRQIASELLGPKGKKFFKDK